ncbi:MAG: crossover junction endodeoxyribonuclease RuvC [Bacteroidales bacterium]|nr:crossover junction endodeoxyribonuclease RuvC [Bacteroidales bacterium]
MLILGIDPGTRILGYSLLQTNELTSSSQPRTSHSSLSILAMDVLYLRNMPDFDLRIRHIFQTTTRLIDSFHPDHLAIESPFFGKNVQSMLKLGRAQGVAIAAAINRDIPYSEYQPTLIKQLVTGNGNATKEQVAAVLRSILLFDDTPRYLDATDALAVAYTCHLQLSSPLANLNLQPSPSNKKHKSVKKQWSEFVNQNPDLIK